VSTYGLARTDSASTFSVAVDLQEGAAVFHVRGEVTGATAAGLRLELRGAIGQPAVLLDLSGVQFIDSLGFGSLIWVLRKIHEHGGVVAISGADARRGVAAAMTGSGLDRLVFLTSTATEGLAWLLGAHDRVAP